MTVHLVTGHRGEVHVTAAEQGALNARLWGEGAYVLDGCAATASDSNTVHIADGVLLVQGRHVAIEDNGEDVPIENGTVDKVRRDLICLNYEMNAQSGIEKCSFTVVKGTTGTSYVTPTVASKSILDGDNPCAVPFATVDINAKLAIEAVTILFEDFNTYEMMMEKIDEKIAGIAGGFSVGTTAPADTGLLWIDTSDSAVLKYYDSSSSAWKATAAVWG